MKDDNLETQRQTLHEDYDRALDLINQGSPDEGMALLKELVVERIQTFPLTDDIIWTDFHSFLDGLLFEDYCQSIIRGRKIFRHPLRPANILFTYGFLLVENGDYLDALEVLTDLLVLDPVCPMYIFETTECYKRLGNWNEAMDLTRFAMYCASTKEEYARCCRDYAYCLGEIGEVKDAIMLYLHSLNHEDSLQAKREIIYLEKTNDIDSEDIKALNLPETLEFWDIPEGICDTVRQNMKIVDAALSEDE